MCPPVQLPDKLQAFSPQQAFNHSVLCADENVSLEQKQALLTSSRSLGVLLLSQEYSHMPKHAYDSGSSRTSEAWFLMHIPTFSTNSATQWPLLCNRAPSQLCYTTPELLHHTHSSVLPCRSTAFRHHLLSTSSRFVTTSSSCFHSAPASSVLCLH